MLLKNNGNLGGKNAYQIMKRALKQPSVHRQGRRTFRAFRHAHVWSLRGTSVRLDRAPGNSSTLYWGRHKLFGHNDMGEGAMEQSSSDGQALFHVYVKAFRQIAEKRKVR